MDERREPELTLSPARAKMLEALDRIEQAEEDLGASIQYVAVVYCGTHKHDDGDVHEVGGTVCTDEPAMMTGALLREAAGRIECGTYCAAPDDDPE